MSNGGKIEVQIAADASRLRAQLNDANQHLHKFGREAATVGSSLRNVFATAFAGLSAAAFVNSIKSVLEEADKIGKMAQSFGVAAEDLSALTYAAQLSDVSLESLGTALKKISVNAADAAQGTGEAKGAFKALGIDVKDASGKVKSADKLIGEIATRFEGMRDGANKTALAVAIFGRAGADLIPMLNEGSQGLEQMRSEAEKFGLIISTETAEAADKFNDDVDRLSLAVKGLRLELAKDYAGPLGNIAAAMAEAARESGILQAAWVGLGGVMHELLLGGDIGIAERNVRSLADQITALNFEIASGPTNPALNEQLRILTDRAREAQKVLDRLNAQLKAGPPKAPAELPEAPGIPGTTRTTGTGKTEGEKALDRELKAYNDYMASVRKGDADQVEANQKILDGLKDRAQAIRESLSPLEAYNARVKELQILGDYKFLDADEVAAGIEAAQKQMDELNKKGEETDQTYKELGLTFASAFEDAIVNGGDFREVLKGIEQDLLRIAARKLITEKLGNLAGDFFAGLIPGFAAGTPFAPGGLALVGENGPELVSLPRGSQVYPTGSGPGGGGNVTVNVDARGSTDPGETERAVRRAVQSSIAQIRNMKQRGQLPEFA